jgi:predicted permease
MHDIVGQFRFALRQLRRNRGFSLTAILTLAIGIGATTAIFSIFYAVLLRPLPYPQPDRLVTLTPLVSLPNGGGTVTNEVSYPDFRDWRDQAHSFDSIASFHAGTMILNPAGDNAARNLQIGVASSDFFPVLRIAPMIGRNFLREEERAGNRVVILSHELWVSGFHSSPSVIGTSIKLSDELYTVVGVLPDESSFVFVAPSPIELWTTAAIDSVGKNPSTEQRGWHQVNVIARLKPGTTLAQAKSEMDSINHSLSLRYPDSNANDAGVRLTPALDDLVGDIKPALRLLLISVSALLLIACANVAGLLLARGSSRQTELAVRAALGAGRGRIALDLLYESVLLSLLGGLGGIFVAIVTLKGMLRFLPKNLPRLSDITVNLQVLLFALLISMLTGIVFGLLPAWRLAGLDPALAMRDGTRTSTAGRRQHRLHSALVIAETALGLILLVGAGLLIRSFLHIIAIDPGFNPDHILTLRVGLSDKTYPGDKSPQFFDQLMARLDALPGAKSATAAFPMPFSGGGMNLDFSIENHPTKASEEPDALADVVQPGYFETLQIPLHSGRSFTPQDNRDTAPAVAVINEALARKFFPNEDPVGKRIRTAFDETEDGKSGKWRTIVGVVGNAKRRKITEDAAPEYYVPFGQAPVTIPYLALRVTGDPVSYAHAVSSVVAGLDPQIPVYRLSTMEEGLANASSQSRFQTLLLTAFAAMALLLAAIGLYAVLSYMVSQRTHEIGLRMALGAQRTSVLKLILNRGMALALIGVALGIGVSALLTRFLGSLLYGVKPLDPVTFICVSGVLLAVSAIASVIPASRAAGLDPMKTLRDQ